MYVCICNEVTDKEIKKATSTGICSMKELRSNLNIGTSCGKCSRHAKGLLNEYLTSDTQLTLQPT